MFALEAWLNKVFCAAGCRPDAAMTIAIAITSQTIIGLETSLITVVLLRCAIGRAALFPVPIIQAPAVLRAH